MLHRFADGPNQVFSGGPLVSGELHSGPEPDWSLTNDIKTIELQLLAPPRSRRIWIGAHDGRLYVFSGFMDTTVVRLWKRWPVQAEHTGEIRWYYLFRVRTPFCCCGPPVSRTFISIVVLRLLGADGPRRRRRVHPPG